MSDKQTTDNEYDELSYAQAKALDPQILRQELAKREVNSKGSKKTLLNRVKYYSSRGWPSRSKKSTILGIKRKIEEMDLNGSNQNKTQEPDDEPPTKKRQLNDKSEVAIESAEIKQKEEEPTQFEQAENEKEEEKRDVQSIQPQVNDLQKTDEKKQNKEDAKVMDIDDGIIQEKQQELSDLLTLQTVNDTNNINNIEQESRELLTPQPLAFPSNTNNINNTNNTNDIQQIEQTKYDKDRFFNNMDSMDIEEPMDEPTIMDQVNDKENIAVEPDESTEEEEEEDEDITIWERLENCHSDEAINELEKSILDTIEMSLMSINMSNDIVVLIQDMCKFRFVRTFNAFDINRATEDEKALEDEFYGEKYYRLKKIPKYIKNEMNKNDLPQFGDIITGNMRLSGSYWVDIDGETLVYSQDEMAAGYMQIPYKITQHMRDACIFYKIFWNKKSYENSLVYITSITVRSDEYDLINNIFDKNSVNMLKKIGLPKNESYQIGCDEGYKKVFFNNDVIHLDQIKTKPSLCFDNPKTVKIVKK